MPLLDLTQVPVPEPSNGSAHLNAQQSALVSSARTVAPSGTVQDGFLVTLAAGWSFSVPASSFVRCVDEMYIKANHLIGSSVVVGRLESLLATASSFLPRAPYGATTLKQSTRRLSPVVSVVDYTGPAVAPPPGFTVDIRLPDTLLPTDVRSFMLSDEEDFTEVAANTTTGTQDDLLQPVAQVSTGSDFSPESACLCTLAETPDSACARSLPIILLEGDPPAPAPAPAPGS